MPVFSFILLIVLITTVGKILTQRQARMPLPGEVPQIGSGEIQDLRESIDNLNSRLHLIEEERDFYKQLLDSPKRGELPPTD